LGNKTKTVPQDIGFDKQGNFVWGDDLRDALADNRMDPEHVIIDLKLSLYKDHATSEIADRVKTHLQHFKISKETLLSLHLKAFIEKAVTFAMGVCDKWSISDPTVCNSMLRLDWARLTHVRADYSPDDHGGFHQRTGDVEATCQSIDNDSCKNGRSRSAASSSCQSQCALRRTTCKISY
jgi:hypothetical protein